MSSPEPEPRVPVPTRTVVIENGDDVHLLWFDGFVPLPIGARIELTITDDMSLPLDVERFETGSADAVVTGLKVVLSSVSPTLVLEVDLSTTVPIEPPE